MMLKRFLDFQIRKDLIRDNKKLNHQSFTRSLPPFSRILHLMKYHKKKTVLAILIIGLDQFYDLKRKIYYYIVSMQSPKTKVLRYVYGSEYNKMVKRYQPTIGQQSTLGIKLPQPMIQALTKVYYQTDRQLYFGVGRNYLFKVYKQLGLLQKQDQQRNFWMVTGFHKERNQKASGVGCVEFINLFQQAYNKLHKSNKELTKEHFFKEFIRIFISKYEQVRVWEKQFNEERQKQFIKNVPGESQKRQTLINEVMQQKMEIQFDRMQQKMQQFGLKGMNLSDRHLYWRNRAVWLGLQKYYLCKNLKFEDQKEKRKIEAELSKINDQLQTAINAREEAFLDFDRMYKKPLF